MPAISVNKYEPKAHASFPSHIICFIVSPLYSLTPHLCVGYYEHPLSPDAYVNAYAYFNFGTNLNNYFTKNNTNLASVKDYIDTNYVDVVNQQNNNTLFIPNWTVKKSSNKVYIADVKSTTNEKHGRRFKEFYNNAKAYNLPGHVGESLSM